MYKLTQEHIKLIDEFYWDVESGRLCPSKGIWFAGEKEDMLKRLRKIFDCGEYNEEDKHLLNTLREDYIEYKKSENKC